MTARLSSFFRILIINVKTQKAVSAIFHYCFTIQFLFLLFPSLTVAKETGNNKNFPDTLLVKVTLIYYNSFFCSNECQKHPAENCSKIVDHPHRLMCPETATLIRPKILADQWNKEQYQHGYIDLTIKEFGIEHARAHITNVTPFISGSFKTNSYNESTELVTGVFKRHSFNVSKYTFKNVNTGKTSSLLATSNHRFYLKNRRNFLAIKNITKKDTLITSDGNSVKRVYSDKNTGITDNDKTNSPALVYNLEIQKKHTYFVGYDRILVHNFCECQVCGNTYLNTTAMKRHLETLHQLPPEDHHYKCGIKGCTFETKEIEQMTLHENEQHKYFCGLRKSQFIGMKAAWQHIGNEHPRLFEAFQKKTLYSITPPSPKLSDDLFLKKMQEVDDLLPDELLHPSLAPEHSHGFSEHGNSADKLSSVLYTSHS